MSQLRTFTNALTPRQRTLFARLSSPEKIQEYLDGVRYCGHDNTYHCPLVLVQSHSGCCFAGALFGALALCAIGHKPLIVELKSEHDYDHILAVYKKDNCWGAVAKSHCVGLRSRGPVYKTLRELTMSYFEHYFNHRRERTLRSYSLPLDLSRFIRQGWMTSDDHMNDVADAIDRVRHIPIVSRKQIRNFTKADRIMCRVGTMTGDT